VQPYLIETINGPLGVSHNGNLTNALDLRKTLLERGVGLSSSTDSEVITQMLAAPPEVWTNGQNGSKETGTDVWVDRLKAFMQVAEGAFTLVVLTRNAIYTARDPLGLRPLCIGNLPNGGYVVASESCALPTIGAKYMREVQPGEIIRLDKQGVTAFVGQKPTRRALCIFEYVYFARPDSMLEGQVIHAVRQCMGAELAIEAPAEADVVVGVPDSATPAAIGYSLESGIPYTEGLIKNRYIGRTFIEPDDSLRQVGINLKYNPLTTNLKDKRVVLVDDSIVRGNTAGPMVQLMREGGASEVHVRVSSPPVRHPCFMGVDMATYKQLIAANLDIESIRQRIGADSLAYLSMAGLTKSVRSCIDVPETGHCNACFSGNYPINIPAWLFDENREKLIFEEMWG
jgi:amidophosphoribosyltransferase